MNCEVAMNHPLTLQNLRTFCDIWDWGCNQLPGLSPKQWTSRKRRQDCKKLNQERQSIRSRLFSFSTTGETTQRRGWAPRQLTVCLGDIREPTFKELLPLVKSETVRLMPLPRDKSQTRFEAEIEELADVRSYKVKTEDGRILRRDCRHLCRSRESFYSSQPSDALVALQPPDMAASP